MNRYASRILSHLSDRRYQPSKRQQLAMDLGVAEHEQDDFWRSINQMVDEGQVVLSDGETFSLPPLGREFVGTFRLHDRGFGFIVADVPTGHGDLFVPPPFTGGALTGDRVRARVIHESMRSDVDPSVAQGHGVTSGDDDGSLVSEAGGSRAAGVRVAGGDRVGDRGDRGDRGGRGRSGGGGARAGGRGGYHGQIVEIIQRSQRQFVGNLRKLGSQWVAEMDGRTLKEPVIIKDPQAKNARAGDKVVVELIEYPRDDRPAQGVITQVLGEQGEPDVETLAVMRTHGLSDGFPAPVMEEARQAALSFHDGAVPPDRLDLTQEFICTIDPPDAKDYDDAISLTRLDGPQRDGAAWELGVHIADVSHFVRRGSALDAEALARGNSTYLPRRVVPMLPELLSNGVCSLQEGVNRFCLSAFMRYDDQGRVLGQRFARSVIRSAKRLTYLEAQALIEGDLRQAIKHARTEPKYPRKLIPTLEQMDRLAKAIRQRRLDRGMITLALPKVELVFDDSGRVVDAQPEDDCFTHTMIEMFMVEANEAAARLFDGLTVPMIRRIHADPPSFDFQELRSYCRVAGFNIPSRPTKQELQSLLNGVRGKPAEYAVHLAVLRTLSRAEYSPMLIGHYALASEHYTHFTSPIRRYPDLVVHRGLAAYLEAARQEQNLRGVLRRMTDDPRCPDEPALTELGKHCSATERNSGSAEDDLRTYLVLDLLRQHLGDDYQGTVTGVSSEGVYVRLDRFLTDGFVRSNDLPGQVNDVWRMNRNTGSLVAQRSGKTIAIGDKFTVRVARVNPVRRHMELVIVGSTAQPPKPRKRSPLPGVSQSHRLERRIKRQRRDDRRNRRKRK